jgi:tetratricopeptide (TPR) repeat protein
LYRKIYPDGHSDLTNSLYNVAVVLREAGKLAEAVPYFNDAIKLRRKLFGEDHPDTALLEMELAGLYSQQGQLKAAFEPCLRAHFSFVKYFGSEYAATIATQSLLEKLPRPK